MIIITISEIRRNVTQIIRQIQEQDDFAIITQHGKPVAVLLSYQKYNALVEKLEDLEDALALYCRQDDERRPFNEYLGNGSPTKKNNAQPLGHRPTNEEDANSSPTP